MSLSPTLALPLSLSSSSPPGAVASSRAVAQRPVSPHQAGATFSALAVEQETGDGKHPVADLAEPVEAPARVPRSGFERSSSLSAGHGSEWIRGERPRPSWGEDLPGGGLEGGRIRDVCGADSLLGACLYALPTRIAPSRVYDRLVIHDAQGMARAGFDAGAASATQFFIDVHTQLNPVRCKLHLHRITISLRCQEPGMSVPCTGNSTATHSRADGLA